MIKKFHIAFLCLFLCETFANQNPSPLVRHPETSYTDYHSYLAVNKNFISFTNHLLKKQPSKKNKNTLFRLLTKAQKSYLEKTQKEAVEKFKKIVNLKFKDDWSLAERKIIFYSFLRLSQIDDKNSKKWLKESVIFDSKQKPPTDVFSPQFYKKWLKEKNQIKYSFFQIPDSVKKDFPVIKINGRLIKSNKKIKVVKNELYRVHFLSNKYQPIFLVTKLKNLKSHLSYSKKALVQGNCYLPDFELEYATKALFPDQCLSEKKFSSLPVNLYKTTDEKKVNLWETDWIILAGLLSGFFTYKLSQKNRFYLDR